MTNLPEPIGVYLHIPFCDGKCPYCDFFSKKADEQEFDRYTEEMVKRIYKEASLINRHADTVYFGGGTPSLLGSERLNRILKAVQDSFGLTTHAEVTVEVNPTPKNLPDFYALRKAGFNRLSMGLQSANANELQILGRKHTAEAATKAVTLARQNGFENISLDLMLAIPYQTTESLKHSVEFCAAQECCHISCYLLKIEEGTPFFKRQSELPLFDDEQQADFYLQACELLEQNGYKQYEISNFAKKDYESRHNLKYWHDEEYIGIGASAHAFINGKRFYYPRSLEDFYADKRIEEGNGGDEEEYIMLALRLTEGLCRSRFQKRFGYALPQKYFRSAQRFVATGLTEVGQDSIKLTRQGFLVSNALIAEILS
ncbi:MAG: radical SAM family heme chaperone HemW [Acutalibacteraceae bacterium]